MKRTNLSDKLVYYTLETDVFFAFRECISPLCLLCDMIVNGFGARGDFLSETVKQRFFFLTCSFFDL